MTDLGVARQHHSATVTTKSKETDMYGMYPEWGPAKHRTEDARMGSTNTSAVQAALDLRDGGAQRPDDN